MRLLVVVVVCFAVSHAHFSRDFSDFINSTYGKRVLDRLERRDLGQTGSFGGYDGKRRTDGQLNNPIVFVHGVTLRAIIFDSHRKYFLNKGYDNGELFASTYGDGGATPMSHVAMRCSYVEDVRQMIMAVHEYTHNKVDVIAFSMGAAISRKAILGGSCVDTHENLGEPLTDIINTYITVGGVVNGYEGCPSNLIMCNSKNGMICSSEFMRDVNSVAGYEGTRRYGVYSLGDRVVGQKCCGNVCSRLANATDNVIFPRFGHIGVLVFTLDKQNELLHPPNN